MTSKTTDCSCPYCGEKFDPTDLAWPKGNNVAPCRCYGCDQVFEVTAETIFVARSLEGSERIEYPW